MAQVFYEVQKAVANLGGHFSAYRVREICHNQRDGTVKLKLRLDLYGSLISMQYELKSKRLITVTHTFKKIAEVVNEMHSMGLYIVGGQNSENCTIVEKTRYIHFLQPELIKTREQISAWRVHCI